jgi:hypothetical protein
MGSCVTKGETQSDGEALPAEAAAPPAPEVSTAATPEPPAEPEMTYAEFGENFMRMVLHRQRVLASIDRVLGEKIELGPIGAGPGRVFAKLRATGWFQPTSGVEIPGDLLAYRVILPIDVDFEIEIARDVNRFRAKVLTILWDITGPREDEVSISVETDKRRSAVLQKVAGLDAELRRFLMRVVEVELAKPHVKRATRLDMRDLIAGAWPAIADQFLPVDGTPDSEVARDLL